jgi:hypothetical protein
MRGLKRLRSARVISTGYEFVQNLRRGRSSGNILTHPEHTSHDWQRACTMALKGLGGTCTFKLAARASGAVGARSAATRFAVATLVASCGSVIHDFETREHGAGF